MYYHVPNENCAESYLIKDACKTNHMTSFLTINPDAKTYYTLLQLQWKKNKYNQQLLTNNTFSKLNYTSLNQAAERHVKVVTQASANVLGFERRLLSKMTQVRIDKKLA